MYPEIKKFQNLDKINGLEIVNLGTGFGYYDFDYKDIKACTFNFALPRQSLQFDYKLLVNYYKKLKTGCTVCVVLPYFIFCADFFKELEVLYERYYSILPRAEVEGYTCTSYSMYMDKLKGNSIAEETELLTSISGEKMEIQVNESIEDWKKTLNIADFLSGELSEHIIIEIQKTRKRLDDILKFCIIHQFNPIIIVPPMSQLLLDKISIEFRKTHFYDVLYETVGNNFPILDYTENKKYCNSKLYGCSVFLTKSAAREFTRDIVAKIEKL
ncbi:MAG: hypothetical protein LUG83_05000 [Lachnospiraceae bacterium]|nr:hypothetical protein [Lachnospiraceae bacterium]